MEERARLRTRLESLNALGELFSAMQAMAATRVQAAQSALRAARIYADGVGTAISDAAALLPVTPRPTPADGSTNSTMLVVCSEHGFVGAFNRLLLERARSALTADEAVAVVGRKGCAVAVEEGIKPAWSMPMATSIDGVLATARRTAVRLGDADTVRIVFGTIRQSGSFEIEVRQVLPPDPKILAPREGAAEPLHQLPPQYLLRQLIGELLLSELVLGMIESFASENAGRLQIMQSAHRNISAKVDGLTQTMRQIRQEEITSELLEAVVGAEAVAELAEE